MSVRVGCKISVQRITVWHHEACRVMTYGDHEGCIFGTGVRFAMHADNIAECKMATQK